VSTVGPVVERTAVDGVPVLWATGPEPFAGALVFRVGLADETLATLGLSHLVEHLALHRGGRRKFDVNGFVDETRTVFWAAGTREEVCGFLSDVAAGIGSLPLERLDTERRVLLTEAQGRAAHPLGLLLRCRFGVTGFGLLDCVELGLHRVDAGEVAAWAREWFTSGNAAVWLTGPPTDDFSLPLLEGARRLHPEATPIPGLKLPAHLETGSGAVQLAFLTPRSVAAAAAAELAGERADEDLRMHAGLSYAAGGLYWPLTATTAHVSWRADCLDEHALDVRARLLAALDSLADPGPTPEELADYAARSRRRFTDPRAVPGYLDSTVHNLLVGAPQETPEELLDRVASLTGDDVAAVVREGLPTMLLASPERTPPPAQGFVPYLDGSERMTPVDGIAYPVKGWRSRSRILTGAAGTSFVDDTSGTIVTVLADDVVALLSHGVGAANDHRRQRLRHRRGLPDPPQRRRARRRPPPPLRPGDRSPR
jgi:predicted Zn-dependent peptidase